MPEKNYLPGSGRINLNNNRDNPFNPQNRGRFGNNPYKPSTSDQPKQNLPIVQDVKPVPAAVEPASMPQNQQVVTATTEPFQPKVETPNNNANREVNTSSNSGNYVPPANNEASYEDTGRFSKKFIAIAAIIIGLVIITAGFVSYRYFNRLRSASDGNAPVANVQIENDSEGIVGGGKIASGVSTSRADAWENPGDSSGISEHQVSSSPSAPTPSSAPAAPNEIAANTAEPAAVPKNETSTATKSTGSWKANNYNKGDIKSGSYTVVRGDTLWEIAEAVYGNGNQWHQIATANHVGTMANGHPLILPGQVLNIPT